MKRSDFVRRARITLLVFAAALAVAVAPIRSFGQANTVESQNRKTGGFVNRVFHDATGDHKYVVFVPRDYRPDRKWPAILFLHGAGERGTDGIAPTTAGLGPMVKERADTFSFLVVFPQCEDVHGRILTAWSPSSPDGKRALAIFDAVASEFSVDADKRILTGWSMGGYGTWSLGAADPARWSALVPVSGGGDPAWAPRLKNSRIWAFAGAQDNVVRAQETRQMVDAIRKAGGHPVYTEVPDAGHDVWRTAYADDRLYAWMQSSSTSIPGDSAGAVAAQNRPRGTFSGRPGVKSPLQAGAQEPFIPAVAVPGAISVRLGNEALRAVAHSAMKLIPPDALTGWINDIYTSTEAEGYSFGVQFTRISYSAQVARAFIKAYAKDRLNIQLAVRNATLTIGTTYVQGSGRSAVAGPISIVIGYRSPVWLSFDVTPYVDKGRLRLQLVATRFQIPDDNWYVTSPYGVSTSGLGMTSDRVAGGLVSGIYGQKYRIEQEAAAIVPTIVAKLEEKLDLAQVGDAANAFWPLPVYRPRLRVWPETVRTDENGVSLTLGVMAAAIDARNAPSSPRVVPPAGAMLDSVPQDSQLRLGVAPGILEPLTQMLIDEDVARINVLDIPDKAFAGFADRKSLASILPDVASLPDKAEIWAELVLKSPIDVRDARGESADGGASSNRLAQHARGNGRVTVMKPAPDSALNGKSTHSAKAPADPAAASPANGSPATARPFAFIVPKAVISLAVKNDPQDAKWKPYAEFEFALSQKAAAGVVRYGFSQRLLRIDWVGEPDVKTSAHFAAGITPKDATVRTDKLRDAFVAAWKNWTQNGPASQTPVADVDFQYAKLRLDGVEWTPPVLSVLFDAPGIMITNSSKTDLVYEMKDIYSTWSAPITLRPGKSNEFKVADPLLFRQKAGDQFVQTYTLPVGSHCEFRVPLSGGEPRLFQVRESAPTR